VLRLQPTRVRLSTDENACLVYVDNALTAVLVQLSASVRLYDCALFSNESERGGPTDHGLGSF
jgi:hypothetical protein